MDEDTNPFEAHALVVTYGDCEFYGECRCGAATFGMIRPDQSLDTFVPAWERHSMAATAAELDADRSALLAKARGA